MPDKFIRVMIVDDHSVVREGLAALIGYQADMRVVATPGDGRAAVEEFSKQHPDVTLMDLRLPVVDGVEAIIEIRGEHPDAKMIVLTTYDGDEDVYRALEAGACGYLLKDASRNELLEAIRTVHQGGRCVPPAVAARLVERAAGGPPLSPREVEILQLIAAGKSNKQIGTALHIAEGTVKTHVNNILDKLRVQDRTGAVVVALRRGIIRL